MVYQGYEMASKIKATFSMDEKTASELAALSDKQKRSKSQLVEEALELLFRQQLEQDLRRGYQAMAEEDRRTAEENLPAAAEVLE